ncbi:hypothetical protein V6N11_025107 [Hibiscus sabdariffa]|uniref:Uncharacterized protein n=1 Tax=Hibiscus sabdariffa TaxID=183260 RepID=A0ABR2QP20_9ROSI
MFQATRFRVLLRASKPDQNNLEFYLILWSRSSFEPRLVYNTYYMHLQNRLLATTASNQTTLLASDSSWSSVSIHSSPV